MSLTTRSEPLGHRSGRAPDDPYRCALVLPSGEGDGGTDRPADEHGRADDQRPRRAGPNALRAPGILERHEPISFAYQWVRCGADGGRPDGGDCAIVSGATSRDHRLGASDVGFRIRVRVTATNSDGSRTAASNPTGTVVGPPVNTSTAGPRGADARRPGRDCRPGHVDREIADLVLVPLAALQLGWRRVRVDRRRERSRSYRRRLDDVGHKLRFNVTARNSLGSTTVISTESAIVTEPLPAGAIQPAERRDLDPGGERAVEPAAVVSQVLFSPNPVTGRNQVDHGARPGEGHARLRRPRRARLRALDAARDDRRRPPGDDDRRLGDVPARAERELPAAAQRLQRPVLREGVPLGRSRPRRASRATGSCRCGR